MFNSGKNLLLTFFLAPALVVSTTDAAETEPVAPAQESSQPVGISANPGAVNQITGTGQAGEWLVFTKDSGVFLGGVWAGDTNYLISGGEQPRSWSWDSLLILSLGLDSEKLVGWKGGKFGIDFCDSTGILQINGLAACRDTIRCPAYRHYIGRNFINCGGGRSSSTENSSSASEKWCQRLISIMFCAPFQCGTNPFSFPQCPASFSRLFS